MVDILVNNVIIKTEIRIVLIFSLLEGTGSMKYSKQRELILNALREHPVHPTAEQLYIRLRDEGKEVSLGTIYRNLGLLARSGVIQKICIPNDSDRFDGCMDRHYHVICDECGEVTDVGLGCMEKLEEQIQDQTGFAVTSHDLVIRGICKNCQHKKL